MPAAASVKVMVIDDQQTMRSLVRNGLREIGMTDIREASDGEDGLRQLLGSPVNLVISDYNMPKLDGLNLLRYALKRLAQETDHPISKDHAWRESLERCLGEDALNLDSLAKRKQRELGANSLPLGLGDFFFDSDDPLHPDSDSDDDDINGF